MSQLCEETIMKKASAFIGFIIRNKVSKQPRSPLSWLDLPGVSSMVLNTNVCKSEETWSMAQEERKLKDKSHRHLTEGTWCVCPAVGRAWVCAHDI